MADDGTEDILAGPRWKQRAARSRRGNTRGDRVQLYPLEAELPEAN